jgi:hypothetical protein
LQLTDCQRFYAEQEALANNTQAQNSTEFSDVIPQFRCPSKAQLTGLVNRSKKRHELARKSFEALRFLAKSRPDMVIELVQNFSIFSLTQLDSYYISVTKNMMKKKKSL